MCGKEGGDDNHEGQMTFDIVGAFVCVFSSHTHIHKHRNTDKLTTAFLLFWKKPLSITVIIMDDIYTLVK